MSDDTTEEILRAHEQALNEFGARVRAVAPGQWSAATPCTDWSVRDLVNHLTSEQLWVPELLHGATMEQIGDRYEGDQLGDDPVGVWERAAAAAHAAFAEPGALDRQAHLSYGLSPVRGYCSQMIMDAVVHTWDLARAVGAQERLPERLVDFATRELEPYVDQLPSGLFAPPVAVSSSASAQQRLLAMTGREA